ncbi:MAG: Holliday junction resolvase RuvX [Deltaproteobacteria bacterium]|nr:Holliday junction resolvase RuvX [Deltaproteobacteria bacterium]
MRIMGIDAGSKRIGVALSDELGLTAQPLTVVETSGGSSAAAARIAELCSEHEVERVVVGLPLALDGGDRGQSSRRARALGKTLTERGAVEVVFWDERFSTAEAERVLVTAGVRRDKRRRVVDKLAAALILQGYLDAESRES